MESKVKKIGVLTSGGDAPGMNAAIRAVVRCALAKGIEVVGIKRGYNGLIHKEIFKMNRATVSDIIHRGGTVLYTARCLEFKEDAGVEMAKQTCIEEGIDGLVVIGGDGSYRGARDLSQKGIPCVGIPGTIDNDISSTDYTIGYDTAMNTVVDMVDKLRDTMQSHERCSVVEVMGRRAGHIALNTGIACGATAIITLEEDFDFQRDIVEKINFARSIENGKTHFIVMISEGHGNAAEIAKRIQEETGVESRECILGHVQRGGAPTLRDRVLATRMGNHAVELLSQGIGNRVVGIRGDVIVDYDILEGLNMKKTFDHDLYEISKIVSL
jgi:6-phosphofructokinase 1